MLQQERIYPWLLGLALFFVYLATPSYYFNFDGVACAMAIELENPRYLVHGNHLLYGVFGFLLFKLWSVFGYAGRAITVLTTFNALLNASSAAIFYQLLRDLKIPAKAALFACLGLAFSYNFWFWSLEAQVYPLGFFFLILTTRLLFSSKPSPWRLGLIHAMAILGHVLHIFLIPVVLYQFHLQKASAKTVKIYAMGLGIVLAAAYSFALIFMVRPENLTHAWTWLIGSGAFVDSSPTKWLSGGIHPLQWFHCTFFLLSAAPGIYGQKLPEIKPVFWLYEMCWLICLGWSFFNLARNKPSLTNTLGLWIISYASLLVFWEPYNPNYRLGDLIPLWIALAMTRKQVLLGLISVFLIVNNFLFGLRPLISKEHNAAWSRMAFIAKGTPENSWIGSLEGSAAVYIPYFAYRKPLIVNGKITYSELNSLKDPVYLTSDILEDARWGEFFREKFTMEEIAMDNGEKILRLITAKR